MDEASNWYSAKVRIAILVESVGLWHWVEAVHVFRASGFTSAFQRALALGRTHEQEYANELGKRVRWRLHSVETLDLIRSENLDGAEVSSAFVPGEPAAELDFESVFTPESLEPRQTL